MKKLSLLFVTVLIFLASCDKREVEVRIDPLLSPESGIVGVIYPGNMSCDDLPGSYVATTGKIDFVNGKFVFESGSGWPFGLEVTVSADGKYLNFTLPANSQYCVGAVIAKGGNASNVFTYSPGVKNDETLSAPINSSGSPAQLSNLTFCFVECPSTEPIVIAIKAHFWPGSSYIPNPSGFTYSWAGSSGDYIFNTTDWCKNLGIVYYPATSSFPLLDGYTRENVGTVTIAKGVNSLIITIVLKEGGILDKTYLYAGSLEGIKGTSGEWCPQFTTWNLNETDSNSQTFIIPY